MSFENKKKFCGECGVSCIKVWDDPNDELIGYCKIHYDLIVGTCAGCNKIIDSNSDKVMVNSRRYHKQCYSVDINCSRCSRPIIGNQDYKVALGKNYHLGCFTCTLCSSNLSGTTNFTEISGSPYCGKCKVEIEKNPNAAISNHGVSNTVVINNEKTKEQNNLKTNLYNNLQKGKETCTFCRQIITLGEAIQHNNNVFHHDCFTCAQCASIIGGNSFITNNDGFAICKSCSDKSKAVNCNGCKKPITSTYTLVSGVKYHPTCFVCHGCQGSLEKGYIQKDGNPFCGKCGTAQQPTRTFTHSNSKPSGARPNGRW